MGPEMTIIAPRPLRKPGDKSQVIRHSDTGTVTETVCRDSAMLPTGRLAGAVWPAVQAAFRPGPSANHARRNAQHRLGEQLEPHWQSPGMELWSRSPQAAVTVRWHSRPGRRRSANVFVGSPGSPSPTAWLCAPDDGLGSCHGLFASCRNTLFA